MSDKLKTIAGERSWSLKSTTVKAHVTRTGGHLGPVIFDRKGRQLAPYSVAPWAGDKVARGTPPIIRVLRGDFFCLPFGGNTTRYGREQHPVHGETANAHWTFVERASADGLHRLHLRLATTIRPGQVDKHLLLRDGHHAVYCQHVISGMTGPMPLGHHAMLKFPDEPGSGIVSTSKVALAQTFAEPTEDPAQGGYSLFQPGQVIDELTRVPLITGETTDLTRYPARRGWEDIAILVADPTLAFAWTAVVFPRAGYVWYALRDPRVLAATLLWHSNGGRHYPPWSGRHVNVLGLEDITGYFHYGLAESARANPLSKLGYRTCHRLRKDRPLVVNYIMGCTPLAKPFDRVARIEAGKGQITLIAANQARQKVAVDLAFLTAKAP
jgi:hypothetical protein